MNQIRAALPSLDALIKARTGDLKQTEVFTKILGIRAIAFKALQEAKNTSVLSLQGLGQLLGQMNHAMTILQQYTTPSTTTAVTKQQHTQMEIDAHDDELEPHSTASLIIANLVRNEVKTFMVDHPAAPFKLHETINKEEWACICFVLQEPSQPAIRITAYQRYPAQPIGLKDGDARHIPLTSPCQSTVTGYLRWRWRRYLQSQSTVSTGSKINTSTTKQTLEEQVDAMISFPADT